MPEPRQALSVRMVVVMVGLPARGKTYTARKLARYLTWRGYQARVFNVGNYRRDQIAASVPASFFDPGNAEGRAARKRVALSALTDLVKWIDDGGEIGIYDATNSTRERRDLVRQTCEARGLQVVFVETICTDDRIIEANIVQTKLGAPDYAGVAPEVAVADFRARIAYYERAYEPIDDDDLSWIKLLDVGRQVVVNRIRGHLAGRMVSLLMNLHVTPRSIFLSRHGQSQHNALGLIGGDADLTELGRGYAAALAGFFADRDVEVWCSTLRRTVQTASALDRPVRRLRSLDEIEAGVCDSLTYAEIERRMPEVFAARKADKLRYRYPRGESYEDLMERVEPVLIELEGQRNAVLVVGHQAVLRAVYGYLCDHPREQIPYLQIPLHTVIELTPRAYGTDEHRTYLGPAVTRSASG